MSEAQAGERVIELLRLVDLPDPEKRSRIPYYPPQLSDGQRRSYGGAAGGFRAVDGVSLDIEPGGCVHQAVTGSGSCPRSGRAGEAT